MDEMLQTNICRTCLSKASNYKSLLNKTEGDHRTLCEVLSFVTNIDIPVNDKYPKNVCDECFNTILKADEFKKRCLQSETVLKNGLHIEQFSKHKLTKSEKSNNQFFKNDIATKYIKSDLNKSDFQTVLPEPEVIMCNVKIVKEENDTFLHEDMNDLADSVSIDMDNDDCQIFVQKLEIANTNCTLPGEPDSHSNLKIDKTECKPLSEKLKEEFYFEGKPYDYVASNKFLLVCNICKEEFCNMQLLQDHIQLHKNETVNMTDTYQCPICKSYFLCEATWHEHMKSHNNKLCSKQHKKQKESANIPMNGIKLTLICPKCDSKFPNMQLFRSHLKMHKDIDTQNIIKVEKKKEQFQCSMCMRKFVLKKSLVAHIKAHKERAQMKFICTFCKREFQYKGHLEKHIILVHIKSKKLSTEENIITNDIDKAGRKHECKICGKTFSMLSTLTEHTRIHTGEKPYLCAMCGRGFTQKNNMTQHMMRHQGLKPFKCETCGRGFVSKGELEAHRRKHSGAHPFVCDDCGGSFTTSSSLTKHRRIHTGERPYACDLCAMTFTTSNTLKVHRRTHTGEKPYQCSYCEKAFRQRYDLVSHIRCHTGERPYVCTSCGQGFRKASALKLHIKVHGKELIM